MQSRPLAVTRRGFLAGAAVVSAAAFAPRLSRVAYGQGRSETIELRARVGSVGDYLYLPFHVPAGVNRVDGQIIDRGTASTGLGLFDQRGPDYQSAGFRGVYGGELGAFTVAADRASRSFLPGTIEPGEWTVIVPIFDPPRNPSAEVVVEVTLHFGEQPAPFAAGPAPGVVSADAGWYRGDLHCHTPESSDAWNSGSAMTPRQWADECRRVGLDYVALTDHNVISQNLALVDDAGAGVLLIGGEEMTNWFHGHATVTGLDPGEWLDWRQRPQGVPLRSDYERRIGEFLAVVRELGVYASAAHPLAPLPGLPWQFFADAATDRSLFPDGIEVWTGDYQPDDEASLREWDRMLQRGWRVTANGGSDLHGVVNPLQPFFAGGPTTVVYAQELSPTGITHALQAARCFVTRAPNGAELYLTATGPGEQQAIVGGTLHGGPSDTVDVEVVVRRGALLADSPTPPRLLLIRDGTELLSQPITAQEQTVRLTLPVGTGGYVRAELRGEPFIDPDTPTGSRMDMEAFTNPVWLSTDAAPDDLAPVQAPPPEPTRRRVLDHLRDVDVAPLAAAPAAALARDRINVDGADHARSLTLTELTWHAALDDTLTGRRLRVVGRREGAVLTRWVRDCCARDGRAVQVVLRDVAGDAPDGWVEVTGEWVPGTGTAFETLPEVTVEAVSVPRSEPGRFEA